MRTFIPALVLFVSMFFATPAPVLGQAPDIRDIRPAVMLLIDTSGSMNYDISGSGSTPSCSPAPGSSTRSRWIALLESLTGGFESDYYCEEVPRGVYRDEPDQHYFMPHFQARGTQADNGLLDMYLDRVKFGLMTMDATYGLAVTHEPSWSYLLPASVYMSRLSDVVSGPGDYSYGSARPVSFPGYTADFLVNGGARRTALSGESIWGGLVSVGSDSGDHRATNAAIQSSLFSLRPYGGSAIDALISDFREWLESDRGVIAGSDPLAACRSRYAILISDGDGDDLYRRIGCATPGYVCPYEISSSTVRDLCAFNGTQCTGPIDGFYAVSYAAATPEGRAFMQDLASVGGTVRSYETDDIDGLVSSLSRILDAAAPGTTTRTIPLYVTSLSSYRPGSLDLGLEYEFTTGFRVGSPWSGVLERTRYTCTSPTTDPIRHPLNPEDRFQDTLNNRPLTSQPRVLLTVVGESANSSTGVIIGPVDPSLRLSSSPTRGTPRTTGAVITRADVSSSAITPAHLGFQTGSQSQRQILRNQVLEWLHGVTRPDARLGDIYRSNPAVSSPPLADIADEWFNLWRRREDIIDRPPILYVGTNDGIMHAFAVEEHLTVSGRRIGAGEELWGFVPAAILRKLSRAMISRQILVDGSPVVRNVFFRRLPGETPNDRSYRTVLISGLREGGPHYFALDVSDPLDPRFLWQFTRPEMGPTTANAGVGQVLIELEGVLQERAVAVLPGGDGELLVDPRGPGRGWGVCSVPPGASRRGTTEYPGRTQTRCRLTNQGRALYVVDIASGEVIREFGSAEISAPMTGSVSIFMGSTGTIASRAYMTDDDGVLWRLDMSSLRPANWRLDVVHDLYWADGPLDGAPSQMPPTISSDVSGDVVILAGTGNISDIEGQAAYRVVSITDSISWISPNPLYEPRINWEIRLRPGEQLTGAIELMESRAFFSTFASTTTPTDACMWGGSRIWGVHYLQTGDPPIEYRDNPRGTPFPRSALDLESGSGTLNRHFTDLTPNAIAVGVTIGSTPTCTVGETYADPYLGTNHRVLESGGGTFRLVSHVSGGTAGVPGGSSVHTLSVPVPQPIPHTRIESWIPQVDR